MGRVKRTRYVCDVGTCGRAPTGSNVRAKIGRVARIANRFKRAALVFGALAGLMFFVSDEKRKRFLDKMLWNGIVSRLPDTKRLSWCQRLRRLLWLTRDGKPCNRTGTRK